MESLGNVTLAALFEAAASSNPTPGGGCVSAVGGYFGVSLLLKAIRVSARKRPDPVFTKIDEQLIELASRLLQCAQEDSDAFGQYIRALQLPKASDSEKATRNQALRDATVAATDVALRILNLGNQVLHCAEQVQGKTLPTISADVRACVELVSSMNIVARENAQANLSGLTDAEVLRDQLQTQLARHDALRLACTR